MKKYSEEYLRHLWNLACVAQKQLDSARAEPKYRHVDGEWKWTVSRESIVNGPNAEYSPPIENNSGSCRECDGVGYLAVSNEQSALENGIECPSCRGHGNIYDAADENLNS